jgi:putative transposase
VSLAAPGAAVAPLYKRHRFPAEVISHAVWLYYRFLLSYRDVEELLAERGIAVSYETVRQWCQKFGQTFAGRLRRRHRPGDKWHMDEMQLKISGRRHWLWRAVDQDGVVLDILVQARRNQEAAEAFLRRVLDGNGYRPRVVVTDKRASYPPALRRVLPGVEPRRHPEGIKA